MIRKRFGEKIKVTGRIRREEYAVECRPRTTHVVPQLVVVEVGGVLTSLARPISSMHIRYRLIDYYFCVDAYEFNNLERLNASARALYQRG